MPSSVIAGMRYDTASAVLTIIFVTGKVYLYSNVPEEIFRKMKEARSKGIFFNKNIRDKYDYREVTG